MSFDPAGIPRPQTWADFADCYRANVAEAKREYEMARSRLRQFRDAGQITEKPEGGWVCQGPTAATVLGDYVRWRSDLGHWSVRYAEAMREARLEKPAVVLQLPQPDPRLPPERDEDEAWNF